MELLAEKPRLVGSVQGRRVLAQCDHCGEDRVLEASVWMDAWLCGACKRREFELVPHPGGIPSGGEVEFVAEAARVAFGDPTPSPSLTLPAGAEWVQAELSDSMPAPEWREAQNAVLRALGKPRVKIGWPDAS